MAILSVLLLALTLTDLVGTPAPEWTNRHWLNSTPLKLSGLKGKVVLLRFFMESSCPMCRATAPYLNEFHNKYQQKGLVVIGMYTPKPRPQKTDIATVRRFVEDYGFRFPVAIDDEWSTLNRFWLDRVPDAEFTSVSFLIDRKGVIRFIHAGGSYSEQDAATLKRRIEQLISEPGTHR